MQKLILLALAGVCGTLARYTLAGIVQRLAPQDFPWGTLVVNVVGCFMAGLFWAWSQNKITVNPEARTIVLVGFMGAFTTFSTFALETSVLLDNAQWLRAAGNLAAHNGIGIIAMFTGIVLGRGL